MCWAHDNFGSVQAAALSLNKATVRYIKERGAGKRPAVPDVLWQGDDCWLWWNEDCREFNSQVRDFVLAKPSYSFASLRRTSAWQG